MPFFHSNVVPVLSKTFDKTWKSWFGGDLAVKQYFAATWWATDQFWPWLSVFHPRAFPWKNSSAAAHLKVTACYHFEILLDAAVFELAFPG